MESREVIGNVTTRLPFNWAMGTFLYIGTRLETTRYLPYI